MRAIPLKQLRFRLKHLGFRLRPKGLRFMFKLAGSAQGLGAEGLGFKSFLGF